MTDQSELIVALRRYALGPGCRAFENEQGAMADAMSKAASAIEALQAREGELVEALRPFAEELGRFGIGNGSAHVELRLSGRKAIANLDLSAADFERARNALSPSRSGGDDLVCSKQSGENITNVIRNKPEDAC